MHISTFVGFLASIPAMVAAVAVTTPVSRVVSVEARHWANFSRTCHEIQLVGDSVLRASCESGKNARLVLNELDLDHCIRVPHVPRPSTPSEIELVFEADGNFTNECKGCKIAAHSLRCNTCKYLRGSDFNVAAGYVNLDDGIENHDGYLTCDGGVGTRVSDQTPPVSRDVDAAQDSVWFSHNCKNISLVGSNNSTLRATCAVLDAGYGGVTDNYLTTELDLNLCVGVNENLAMVFKVYGKFINYCDQLWIGQDIEAFVPSDSPFLHGFCYPNGDHSQAPLEGNLNLDAGIGASNDGYLTCRGGQGTVVSNA